MRRTVRLNLASVRQRLQAGVLPVRHSAKDPRSGHTFRCYTRACVTSEGMCYRTQTDSRRSYRSRGTAHSAYSAYSAYRSRGTAHTAYSAYSA
eukprot:351042-Chlamydomonas_euryale.AAC.1